MNKIRVAVIGGSITGSSCFILLSRLKHLSVVVFEKRNQNQLKNHGYGLGFPNNLLNTMKGIDLIDENFSSINIKNREHYFYKKNDDSESFIFNQKTIFIKTDIKKLMRFSLIFKILNVNCY